ncbi:pilus assembly protein TadG-related protein [Cystobacter ferrugineus]|uniref:Putative Flp pilus-assembly TadG-like N-terminal domain-containing protein n=1 Tax=Cystobacter ferrugineus TaxID=83449 RepID=A0A1L9AZ84_9BACT|nr:pilus assembly protein TadG-related protein [Cystobacter ferrugineus]OJH35213.1 hypothetical protein BON30_39855 [Cystobacter ferrugineus]
MVLMVISLFLLTLMVTVTLSIGTKVREKMEVQAVADAAAYSNAAVTARVYNEIALLSRAQIAHMVSMAAVQSLISWSTLFRAHVAATSLNYTIISGAHWADAGRCCNPYSGCTWMCGCSIAAAKLAGLKSYMVRFRDIMESMEFQALDTEAGAQSLRLQDAAMRLHGVQLLEYVRLMGEISGQSLADEIVDAAKAGSRVPGEWSAPGGGDSVSNREIGFFTGATTPIDILNSHHVFAAMGSRGFSFITGRSGIPAMVIQQQLQSLGYVAPPDNVMVVNQGSSYFSTLPNHGALWPLVNGKYSWTDDHGASTLRFNHTFMPCPRYQSALPTNVWLSSTDSTDPTDLHFWSPVFLADLIPAPVRHTLGRCMRCPSMWPTFIDYNPLPLVQEDDNFGQPKNFAVIQRDYGVREASGQPVDPWNLGFRFRFSPSRESGFDNRGLVLADGTNISRQTALSAGITYYHRKGHWKEPPNLLNPYWRATLVPLTVDDQGEDDVPDTLGDVGTGWAAESFEALRANGYEGGP